MQAYTFLNIVAMACAIAAAITVGRTALLKQTITSQAGLLKALQDENAQQKDTIEKQDRRIEVLEVIVHANPGMVGTGHLASCVGCGCGNSSASAKAPKNRNP